MAKYNKSDLDASTIVCVKDANDEITFYYNRVTFLDGKTLNIQLDTNDVTDDEGEIYWRILDLIEQIDKPEVPVTLDVKAIKNED